MAEPTTVIRGGRIVRHDRITDGDLIIKDGVISHIGWSVSDFTPDREIDARGCFVLPGFVDLHVHGGKGFDTTGGLFLPEEGRFDPDDRHYHSMLPVVSHHLARHGVTLAPLATVAADKERLKHVLSLLADYVLGPANGKDGCYIYGAFLEGTFIKEHAFAGAQNPDFFRKPSIKLFDDLNNAARGTIHYVNVTPEFGSKALELIRELYNRGVLVGAGHTAATAKQYSKAIDNGLRVAVHLTNGPTGSSFKPFEGGGALQAALSSTKVFAELIVDGYHIYPGYVCDIIQRKGPYRICLITDAMFATEAKGVTEFEVSGVKGMLSKNGRFLGVQGTKNTLFGSVLTMDTAFCNVVNWLSGGHPGVWTEGHHSMDTDSAVIASSRFSSANPARALHLYEPESTPFGRTLDGCFGSLMVGKRADVTVLQLKGKPGKYRAKVKRTFVEGREVYTSKSA